MKNLLFVLTAAVACLSFLSTPKASAADVPNTIAIILTNHAELGDTGVATGFFLSEASHPWRTFTQAGYDVVFASPEGGLAPIDPKSLNRDDPANAAFLDELPVEDDAMPTETLGDLSSAPLAAVFVAGGHGTMWDLPDHEPLQRLLAETYEGGGVVAAVCHGPAALVNVKLSDGTFLVAGKEVAGFTNAEEDAVGLTETMPFLLETVLKERGATFVGAGNFQANVVTSGRLVTGQNPASAEGTAEAVLELLKGD
ncbi:MAG: type 1 glutamine amidotransferase domain-containing protein [Planctomycetota bacterium]